MGRTVCLLSGVSQDNGKRGAAGREGTVTASSVRDMEAVAAGSAGGRGVPVRRQWKKRPGCCRAFPERLAEAAEGVL